MTVNSEQAQALFALAKQKNRFLMEAVWTRFFPIVQAYRDIIASGTIGDVQRIDADLAMRLPIYEKTAEEMPSLLRFVDPNLSGGGLLDLGTYPLTHIRMALPHPFGPEPLPEGPLPVPQIKSTIVKARPSISEPHGGGDIDESTSTTMLFPSCRATGSPHILAHMSTSIVTATPNERAVLISVRGGHTLWCKELCRRRYRGARGALRSAGRRTGRMPFSSKHGIRSPTIGIASRRPLPMSAPLTFPAVRTPLRPVLAADPCRYPRLRLGSRCGRPMFVLSAPPCLCSKLAGIRDGKLECDRMPWRETVWTMAVLDTIRRQNDYVFPAEVEAV
jgi:hypothetical protein